MTDTPSDMYCPVETILVIDDDENWCFISKRLLSQANACNTILTAKNGLLGIQTLQELTAQGEPLPAIILLDIKMPVLDGFGFLDTLKSMSQLNLSQTRIYICSSSLHPKDKALAESYAVAGFITKPLTDKAIRTILQTGNSQEQTK